MRDDSGGPDAGEDNRAGFERDLRVRVACQELTEGTEETAKHGDTKKRRDTEGGSTGVAKRRALSDRIAIRSSSARSACCAGRPVEPLFSVRLRYSVTPCLAVPSVTAPLPRRLPPSVDHSFHAIHQPGHVEVDQQGGRATGQPQIRQRLRQVDGHQRRDGFYFNDDEIFDNQIHAM